VFEVPSMMSNPPFEGAADIPSISIIAPTGGTGNNSPKWVGNSIIYINQESGLLNEKMDMESRRFQICHPRESGDLGDWQGA
jgi:hypothetical protein